MLLQKMEGGREEKLLWLCNHLTPTVIGFFICWEGVSGISCRWPWGNSEDDLYPSASAVEQWAGPVALPYWPPILSSAAVNGLFIPSILTNNTPLPKRGGGGSCSPYRARIQTIPETETCWDYRGPTAMNYAWQRHTLPMYKCHVVGEEANGKMIVSVLSL